MEMSTVCCKSMLILLTWDYFCWKLAARMIPRLYMRCCTFCVGVEAAMRIKPALGCFMIENVKEGMRQ